MNESQVLSNYESLSHLMGKMSEAAVQGEWESLAAIEQQCSAQVAAMKPVDTAVQLSASARQHKIQLIKKILADDRAIRSRTEVWMEQLQRIIHSNHQQQRLQHAYGGAA